MIQLLSIYFSKQKLLFFIFIQQYIISQAIYFQSIDREHKAEHVYHNHCAENICQFISDSLFTSNIFHFYYNFVNIQNSFNFEFQQQNKKRLQLFMSNLHNISHNMESSAIKELKQKVHKSFLELSNMEQLCREELQTQKIYYQNIIQDLKLENQHLRTKLHLLQPNVSHKTDSIFQDIDQSIILKKKTSNFIEDQSFIDFMQGTNIYDISQYFMGLENQIKLKLNTIPQILKEYFENCLVIAKQSAIIYQELQRSRQKMRSMQIQHISEIQNLQKIKEQKIRKLTQENQKLRRQKEKIFVDYERLNAMYNNQLHQIQGLLKEKNILKFSNSNSLKNMRQYKNEENCDSYTCISQWTIDSESGKCRERFFSPKILKNTEKRIMNF